MFIPARVQQCHKKQDIRLSVFRSLARSVLEEALNLWLLVVKVAIVSVEQHCKESTASAFGISVSSNGYDGKMIHVLSTDGLLSIVGVVRGPRDSHCG